MKSLLVHASLVCLVLGFPQRSGGNQNNGCTCREVICPREGREACECLNKTAQDCFRSRRQGQCPAPVPINCNNAQRAGQSTFYGGGYSGGGNPTVYVTKGRDGRQTVTTVLPGFAWPTQTGPGRQTVTVTQSRRPTPNYPPQESWPAPWETQQPQQTRPPNVVTSTRPRSRPVPTRDPVSVPQPQKPTQELPPRPTTPRPDPWVPPVSSGGEPTWTPVSEPVLPVEQPIETPAEPAPIPAPVPVIPTEPVNNGGVQKCGPSFGKCAVGSYCDPQPLCSIGEDCDGVCFATVNSRFVSLPNSESMIKQPWAVRRKLWQKLLDDGEFVLYRYNAQ